jgi:hypothetical protein
MAALTPAAQPSASGLPAPQATSDTTASTATTPAANATQRSCWRSRSRARRKHHQRPGGGQEGEQGHRQGQVVGGQPDAMQVPEVERLSIDR